MSELRFDFAEVFDEDYLYFYEPFVDDASDEQVPLIWELFELEPGMELLDLACGHGRIANRLAERGVRVTGLDATPLFLRLAREDAARRGVDVEYVEGDMRELPWEARFDRVLSWFTSFGYFGDDDNRRVLREAHRALRPGGRLLIENNNLPVVLKTWEDEHVNERDGDRMIDRATFDPLTSRALTTRTVERSGRTRTFQYEVRGFLFTELRDWLLRAGFSFVEGYGSDRRPLSLDSRRMITIAGR